MCVGLISVILFSSSLYRYKNVKIIIQYAEDIAEIILFPTILGNPKSVFQMFKLVVIFLQWYNLHFPISVPHQST